MKIIKGKGRGRPRIVYTKRENEFYEKNKKTIITGLTAEGAKKSQVKKIFFSSVREEMRENSLSNTAAMKKVMRSRTFTSAEENFRMYKEEVMQKAFKGHKRSIKKHLGLNYREKLTIDNLYSTDEGWEYRLGDKAVLLQRNDDTLVDGYKIIYV